MKRTKIIATVGPASEKEKTLREMVRKGVNVARLNFSHGDFSSHRRTIKNIKKIRKEFGVPIGIMADLQGPRIRVSNQKEFQVSKNESIWIDELALAARAGSVTRMFSKLKQAVSRRGGKTLYLDLRGIMKLIKPGSSILIEDGLIKVKVIRRKEGKLLGRVMNSGVIRPRKGVNIPGISGKLETITAYDREALTFALEQDIDFVALSFVRTAEEIENLRKLIEKES